MEPVLKTGVLARVPWVRIPPPPLFAFPATMTTPSDIPAFFQAVRRGDRATTRALASANPALVRATDVKCFGTTPLIAAAEAADRPMVDLLLELGADINQKSDWWAGGFGVLDGSDDETAAYLSCRRAPLPCDAAARL